MKSTWVPSSSPFTTPTSVPSGRNHREHRSSLLSFHTWGDRPREERGLAPYPTTSQRQGNVLPQFRVFPREVKGLQQTLTDGLVFKVKHFLLLTWDTGTANDGSKEASAGLISTRGGSWWLVRDGKALPRGSDGFAFCVDIVSLGSEN